MGTRKYTAQEMIDALDAAKGLVSVAARNLGCSRTTMLRYIKEMPTVAQAREDAREWLKDYAEGKLFSQIDEGNMTAIIFFLKTQAKDRGYVERQEHAGLDGGPVDIRVIYADDD